MQFDAEISHKNAWTEDMNHAHTHTHTAGDV